VKLPKVEDQDATLQEFIETTSFIDPDTKTVYAPEEPPVDPEIEKLESGDYDS